jgi:hypothetical protein
MKTNDLTHTPRERTSVFITGVDTSTPDDLVKDGMCAKLHNMRYEGSAWRPTHPYEAIKEGISFSLGVSIVYHHPAAGEGKYITEQKLMAFIGESYTYSLYDINSGVPTTITTLTEQAKVSHFGNVLMLICASSTTYLFYRNDKYTVFNLPEPPTIKSLTKTLSAMRPWRYIGTAGVWKDYTDNTPSSEVSKVVYPIANMQTHEPMITTYPVSNDANMQEAWHGEVAFFVAYRMVDGTIISPSMLQIIASEKDIVNNQRVLTTDTYGKEERYIAIEHQYTTAPYEDNAMQFVKGEAVYSIPSGINTDIIDSVVCFATRINSIFDYEKILDRESQFSAINLAFGDNKLPQQPFYLMMSEEITSSVNYVFPLTRSNLENIETNTVYAPDNNVHYTNGAVALDYNNRLHLADTKTTLFSGYSIRNFLSPSTTSDLHEYMVSAKLDIDGSPYYTLRTDNVDTIPPSAYPTPHILSYPDYRAVRYIIQHSDDISAQLPLSPSIANNVAYYVNKPTTRLKYPPITLSWIESYINIPSAGTYNQPNRIQVSATNNCFSFPFENSYAVGSSNNRILALQSAAIEMSDAKFGEMPLYAFTTEGIFALQAGAQTLYSNVIPINYDKIINPNTLAINGAIAYITEKGVHLLTNQGTQVISTPIHDKSNRPPIDFLKVCKMIYPKEHNEIVLLNENSPTGVAYVYNLEAEYWSTRDLKGIKLNTDELYCDKTLYDLANEDESKALPAEIITRPIKLGDVEFKRLETIIPRMATNDKMVVFAMDVDGSVDGYSYSELRKVIDEELESHRVNPITLRRTPFSAKYFKCHMLMEPQQGESFNPSITHIDFEWYRKLRHRMR